MQMFFAPSTMGFYCHEVHGDTMPADKVAISDDLYQSLQGWAIHVVDGLPARKPAEPVDPKPALIAEVQRLLDTQAQARGYDSILAAITYRGDPNPKFASEAEAFFTLRSETWTAAYAYLAEFQAGSKPLPALEDLPGLLPSLSLESSP